LIFDFFSFYEEGVGKRILQRVDVRLGGGKLDEEVFFSCLRAIGGEEVQISNYVEGETPIENFYMLLCPFYNF